MPAVWVPAPAVVRVPAVTSAALAAVLGVVLLALGELHLHSEPASAGQLLAAISFATTGAPGRFRDPCVRADGTKATPCRIRPNRLPTAGTRRCTREVPRRIGPISRHTHSNRCSIRHSWPANRAVITSSCVLWYR